MKAIELYFPVVLFIFHYFSQKNFNSAVQKSERDTLDSSIPT